MKSRVFQQPQAIALKTPLVPKTSLPAVPEPTGFAGSKTRVLLFPERLVFGKAGLVV
jgi:hypothetical protein